MSIKTQGAISDVGPLFRMAAQVPAWLITGLRKQRMGAGLGLRRVEHVFRFSALFANRVIVVDDDRAVRIPMRGHTDAKDDGIDHESERDRGHHGENRYEEHSSQANSKGRHWARMHSAKL